MDTTLFMMIFALFAAIVVFAYMLLLSSFKLLELVQKNPVLWRSLEEPRKVWFESADDAAGDYTIKPLKPWLRWVWSGSKPYSDPVIKKQWRITSLLLKI